MKLVKAEWADQQHRMYLLTSLLILSVAVMFSGLLAVIWVLDPRRHSPFLSFVCLAIVAVGMLSTAGATAWTMFQVIWRQVTLRWSRDVLLGCVLTDGAVWGVIAGIVLAALAALHVVDLARQEDVHRTLTFWRMTAFSSGISLLVPLGLLLVAMDLWAIWNVLRLKMQTYNRRQSFVFYELLSGRDPAYPCRLTPDSFRGHLKWAVTELAPWTRLRYRWALGLIILTAGLLLLGRWRFTTVDGATASRLLWWASLSALILGGDTLAKSLQQGYVLLEALRRLRMHPIHEAFSRVAGKPLDWTLRLAPLPQRALVPLVADVRNLRAQLHDVNDPAYTAFEDFETTGPVGDGEASTPIMATEQWYAISRVLEVLYRNLANTRWSSKVRATAAAAAGPMARAEEVIAYATVFIVRNLLARVVAGLTAGLISIGIVGIAHLVYPFQGRHFWLTADLICFAIGAVLACALLIKFERDPILSALWATTPGRINWTGGLFFHIAITAAVPFILVIASLFPEIGGSLLQLAEPLRAALP